MEKSRKKKSLVNILVAFVSNILIYVLSLFTSKVIKENLGLQVLGLNGVLSNVISILGLSEMGIGAAITFALYKPLAEDNHDLIKSIMNFYKKAYRIVALIVLVIGLLIFPLVPSFIKHSDFSKPYIYLVYSLFLVNSVISYLLVYKRTLIIADQKNYVITIAALVYTYALKISQLAVVYFTSNYILFLIVQILCTFVYNFVVSLICDKIYPYLKEKSEPLPEELKSTFFTKIRAIFWHSLGGVVVFGTDNLLVSWFCGVEEAGRYTSYVSVIAMITNMISLVFNNMQDSIGNFLVTETKEKQKDLFDKLFYLNQSLASVCSVCLALLLTPFIRVWLGSDTVLSNAIIIALVVSFYFSRNRSVILAVKNTAGLFEDDKFAPIIESVINLISSIILAKFFGLIGVVLGTILSTLLVPFWVQPVIVYKKVFNKNVMTYFSQYFMYMLKMCLIYAIVYFLMEKIIKFTPQNFWVFLLEAAVVFVAVCLMWILLTFWKKEFKYYVALVVNKIKRR